jgi:hypothetical protein
MCTLLITDRVLWNTHNCILDVNAICTALVGGLMVAHTRSDAGTATAVGLIFTVTWMLTSTLQVLGVTRLHRMYEVLVSALAVSILSCVFQAQEAPELMAIRSFMFTTANIVLPYMAIVFHQPDADPCVIVCRTLPILLADSELACGWIAVYMMCIGYQARRINKLYDGKPSIVYDPRNCEVVVTDKPSAQPSSSSSGDDPSALLREALARKQMCSP